MSYYGIIDAETLREVEDRVYTQLFKDQLAEIDEELKVAIADDPTLTELDFEFDEIYDETISGLQSAGYITKISPGDDSIILTVSWDEDADDDDGCCCPPKLCKPCC